MISFFEANLSKFAVHHVGNPLQNEHYSLSEVPVEITDTVMNGLLMHFFLSPFEKTKEVYHFMHPSGDLNLNEAFIIAHELFSDDMGFQDASEYLAKQLYSVSNHPKIRAGELYIALFENIQIEGELLTALGIFKSENKESYLKVSPGMGKFDLSYEQEAININKLDKGCLIFNTDAGTGYKVAVIDNTSKSGPAYWIDEFLQLQVRKDSFTDTTTVLSLCKSFITEKLDDEFEVSHSDKVDLLNRSMKYFNEKETFDEQEFAGEIFGNEQASESFKSYKQQYEMDYETTIPQSFEISVPAVKKQARSYKSVIKLDRNFHIRVHGNKELIEWGFDKDKAMNYYKVYFKDESI